MQMPLYDCHKQVRAMKIVAISTQNDFGQCDLLLEAPDGTKATTLIGSEFLNKHDPHVGGYYVAYQDGYTSFSPAEAFEAGYSLHVE